MFELRAAHDMKHTRVNYSSVAALRGAFLEPILQHLHRWLGFAYVLLVLSTGSTGITESVRRQCLKNNLEATSTGKQYHNLH